VAGVKERFREAIIADGGVFALIGNRMYRQIAQNPVYPCCSYARISDVPLYSQEKDALQGTTRWARFQVDVWSMDDIEADVVATAIEAALQGFNLWTAPASPVVVNTAPNTVLSRRDGIEPNTQPPIYRETLDIKVWYSVQ
jgi:hypothetical protein